MSDQPVAEDATYTTDTKHNRRTPMSSAVFETATPATKRFQTQALDRVVIEFNPAIYY